MSDSSADERQMAFSPEDLVAIVYRTVLKREPDPGGLKTFSAAVKDGMSLEDLLVAALSSPEYRQNTHASVHDGTFEAPAIPDIPDRQFYHPLFSPWSGYGDFPHYFGLAEGKTAVRPDSFHILCQLARQALHVEGEFWECGVYQGGTAAMLADILFRHSPSEKRLRLFDTFTGMPETNTEIDLHRRGDFSDTSLELVKQTVRREACVTYHPGFIPETFKGLERSRIAIAHIDVDIYQSVLDCCAFIYPRLAQGGFMVFDDYGLPSCPGARRAVDEYFRSSTLCPVVSPTGQAIVFASEAPQNR